MGKAMKCNWANECGKPDQQYKAHLNQGHIALQHLLGKKMGCSSAHLTRALCAIAPPCIREPLPIPNCTLQVLRWIVNGLDNLLAANRAPRELSSP